NVLPANATLPGPPTSRTFPETGHTVAGRFLEYWNEHGGLAQQGFPLSEPFQEKRDLDSKIYTVQYFERAVFEAHPANAAPYDVLLSQLGKYRLGQKSPAPPAAQLNQQFGVQVTHVLWRNYTLDEIIPMLDRVKAGGLGWVRF